MNPVCRRRVAFVESLEGRALLSTVNVTSLADSGAGSLRAAIASATSGDTIAFGSLKGTITLASTLAIDNKSLTIVGSGRKDLIVDAGGIDRAFSSASAQSQSISNLTVKGGRAGTASGAAFYILDDDGPSGLTLTNVDVTGGKADGFGGGIYARNSNVALTDCNIYGNAVGGSTAHGGGLYVSGGSLTIQRSSIYDNTASSTDAFAYVFGGGIEATNITSCFLTNVTISGNVAEKTAWASNAPAPAAGGGMWLAGTAQIQSSTIAGNRVIAPAASTATNAGGGLFVDPSNTTYVENSIVADNVAPASADMYSTNTAKILAGFDVIGDGTGSGAANGQYGSKVGTTASPIDAKLGALADNGGGVRTVALDAGSPAIDAAYNTTGPSVDARGVTRDALHDIGAFELAAPAVPTFAARPRLRIAAGAKAGTLAGGASIADSTALTYQWKLVTKPENAADPKLANKAAARTSAAFGKAGTYVFRLTVTAANGEKVVRRVAADVAATATSIHIKQHERTLDSFGPTRMRATVADQFGNALADQPSVTWSMVEGVGSINAATGRYTPDATVRYSHLLFKATAGDLVGLAGNRLFNPAIPA